MVGQLAHGVLRAVCVQVKDIDAHRHATGGSEWVVECAPVVSGKYTLAVTCGGVPLSGSPFTIAVNPGTSDALFSSVRRDAW